MSQPPPNYKAQQELLRAQLMRAQALQRPEQYRYKTGIGAALGGAGNALRAGFGASREAMLAEALSKSVGDETAAAKAQQAALDDTTSPQSVKAQQYASKLLGKRATPEQISGITANNLKESLDALRGVAGLDVQEQNAVATREATAEQARLGRENQQILLGGRQSFEATEAEKDRNFRAGQAARDRELREREVAARAEQQLGQVESGLREELIKQPAVKDYLNASIEMEKMEQAATRGTPSGDIALVYGFMKTMDPGSTVREGEFASASNAANVPDRIRNMYNRAVEGTLLSADQRTEFLATARGQLAPRKALYDRTLQQYTGLAKSKGVDPSRVVLQDGSQQPQRVPAPVGPDGTMSLGAQPAPAAAPAVGETKKVGARTFRRTGPGPNDWAEVTGG